MNRTKAIAIMSAGLLSFSLSACGGPELTESEVLDPTKHVRWASESLMPQWNDAKMVINPLAAVPEAARDLPETLAIGKRNVDSPFIAGSSTSVPASLAITSFDEPTDVLDLQTGAVYKVGPKSFKDHQDVRSSAEMLLVAAEGETRGATVLKTVAASKGLQTARTSMFSFLGDFGSNEDPSMAEVDSKIVGEESVKVLAASAEKLFLGRFSDSDSNGTADIVAIDIATGEETGYEHFDKSSYYRLIAQSGEPVMFYTTEERDVRGRNLASGSDFEVRKDFVLGGVWRMGKDAVVIGRDGAEERRCIEERAARCGTAILRVDGAQEIKEYSLETARGAEIGGIRRSGDVLTLFFDDGQLSVLSLNSGEILLNLSEEERSELDIRDAISDGESIFTWDGDGFNPRIAQSDLATKRLITADADVFPVDSPSGARIWGVKQDDGKDFEARIAVEDLDKF
ncbi:hypothetical protein Q0N48_01925 [Corynebacterium ureicelerivorans]|uniref:hypothetical protein n=1 Tax=Corynebacterium ureicelerivorans TaxID=401472 RepID=UPI00264EA5AF|nr:hypothetical protein [Corynebacterium ureicelerivorans]MDN8604773.1 hypothetical protein [Corynebacterium ureicelerivorans]